MRPEAGNLDPWRLPITDLESLSALAISWKSRIHSDVIGFFPEPLLEYVSKPLHREFDVAEPKAIDSLDL